MFWQIQATINRKFTTSNELGESEWSHTRQVPTFFLDGNQLGILSPEYAEKIAKDIIDPFGLYNVAVHAMLV